ncbi:MAG: helix-turn-helix domain-containing protein, partial [Halobacteriovoraceae bacterium]|nr:helix-turn-helix domain-containing protein [Halobacteriovoraceae bacterium]
YFYGHSTFLWLHRGAINSKIFNVKMKKEERAYLRNLGLKIRSYRERKGWTLEDTEEMGWPSYRHLQTVEQGQRNVTIIVLKRISKLYNIPLSKIVDL